jgi:hypothetical protein
MESGNAWAVFCSAWRAQSGQLAGTRTGQAHRRAVGDDAAPSDGNALFHGYSRSERGHERIDCHGFPAIRTGLRPVNSGSKRGFEKRIERSSKKGLQGLCVGRKYAFTSGAEAVLGGRTA